MNNEAKAEIVLSIVVPVYREEGNIREFLSRVRTALSSECEQYEILFCMDPSDDATETIICEENAKDPRIKLIKFSRRFGQSMCTLAGLRYAGGEAVVITDVDMQDPPGLIPEMFRLWKEGYDVVLPQRRSRTGEPWLKILTARVAYAVIHRISEVQIPPNTGDFRLISRKVVDQLLKLNESHGFIRGMVALVGFRQKLLPFDRPPRFSGQTNYNHLVGSVRIGINGLLCFSRVPVNWIFLIGALMCALGFFGAALSLCVWLAGWGRHQEFWLLLSGVCSATGIQLIALGVLGQYVVRIYDEVKIRPKYIVESTVGIVKDPSP